MCCLTARRDYIPMWSYYAGGHSGVAVHFDSTSVPFGLSAAVQYSTVYPVIEFPRPTHMTDEGLIVLSLLNKADAWREEREYRFINYPRDPSNPTGPRVLSEVFGWRSDQLAVMPPRIVVGLTLGASVHPEYREHLARLCGARQPPIPVFAASLHPSEYKVNFADA